MDSARIRPTAAIALAAIGVIHLILAPEYLAEKAYVGVLFILGGIAACGAAVRLWREADAASWVLGAVIAAGMAAGFVLSRTVGLPGYQPTDWELSGIVSLLLEGTFLLAAAAWMRLPLATRPGIAQTEG